MGNGAIIMLIFLVKKGGEAGAGVKGLSTEPFGATMDQAGLETSKSAEGKQARRGELCVLPRT